MPRLAFIARKSHSASKMIAHISRSLHPSHEMISRRQLADRVYCGDFYRKGNHLIIPQVKTVYDLAVAREDGFTILDINWIQRRDVRRYIPSDKPIMVYKHLIDRQYILVHGLDDLDDAMSRILREIASLPECHLSRRDLLPNYNTVLC